MIQLDIPATFAASMLFVDLGKKAIKRETEASQEKYPAVYYKFLFRSVFFAGAVIVPAAIYFLATWPGWQQLYWTERAESMVYSPINSLIAGLFVIAALLSSYAGHALGYHWLTTGKEKYLRPTYIIMLALGIVLVLVNFPACILVGTYQEFYGNRAAMTPVWKNPYGFVPAMTVAMIYFIIVFFYLCSKIWKENEKY